MLLRRHHTKAKAAEAPAPEKAAPKARRKPAAKSEAPAPEKAAE